jgi:cytochrome c oxidase accessory protein FixG
MTKATQPTGEALYAETKKIQPRKVKGTFRSVKWYAMVVLLAVWHLAPFLRWDRGPGAPDQAILIDMVGRRAYFLFIEIWPQEVYYLTGLLMMAAIALFLMSAAAGRVWCGFLCWQTVYTDLFVAVDRWITGDRNARIKLDNSPWTAAKLLKKGAVNVIWLLISAACGIGFALFFEDAFTLLPEIFTGNAGSGIYTAIGIVGGFCYVLAGFAREQVCIYMCPYGRFQAAMFDEHSLLITYEPWRGEPRAPARKNQSFEGRGHCVDCRMCVQVCPTGVDIRDGLQLGCIGCGLCVDACNGIMDKYGLPRGLIRYDSNDNQTLREKGQATKIRLIRARTLIYTGILAVVGCIMLYALVSRTTLEVSVLHERSPLYVQLGNGDVRNGYTYKVVNMVRSDRTFALSLAGIDGASLEVVGGAGRGASADLDVGGDMVTTFRVYVTVPEAATKGKTTPLYFVLTDKQSGAVVRTPQLLAAPDK